MGNPLGWNMVNAWIADAVPEEELTGLHFLVTATGRLSSDPNSNDFQHMVAVSQIAHRSHIALNGPYVKGVRKVVVQAPQCELLWWLSAGRGLVPFPQLWVMVLFILSS
jgi:hypothetical protein